MTPTPVALLQQAADGGLKLGFEPPNTLTVEPARLCPAEFAEVLLAQKPALLALLRLPFVMVFSQILGETIFFCEDEATRAALVEAGDDPWSIYTKDELQVLVAQNRVAPLTAAELRKVHEIKRTFGSRIATDNGG
jgi:hypothetical protein